MHIIYMDKNHPPNGGIEAVTNLVDENMPKNIEYTKLYLVPKITKPLVENYPFSYEFLG